MVWSCEFCTFINTNDTFLACGACGSERSEAQEPWQVQLAKSHDLFPSKSLVNPPPPPIAAAPLVSSSSRPNAGNLSAVVKPLSRSTLPPAPPPPPPPLTVAPPPAPAKKKQTVFEKIKPILDELVQSERTYVTELQAIVSMFFLPLKNRAQQQQHGSDSQLLLSESECDGVFRNVHEILRLNLELLSTFDRADGTPGISIADKAIYLCKVFQEFVPHLQMYAFYAITFDEAAALLKRLEEEKPQFQDFVQATSSMNSIINGQPLSSFLIKPIQRVCKYPLFFHQIIKAFDEEDAEQYGELLDIVKQTLEAAGNVANKINQDKLRAEQNLRGFEVAKRIEHLTAIILEPGRRYVGEWKCLFSAGDSSLAKKRRSSSLNVKTMLVGEKKGRTCFLFNNALLICKEVVHSKAKQTFELKLWISLDQLQLCGIDDTRRPVAVSTNSNEGATNPASSSSSVPSDGFGSYSKQFKLALDIVHVAGADRALTAALRERQHNETQANQPLSQIARLPSYLMLPRKNSTSLEEAVPVVTSYTMWFRSGAERARVDTLLQRVHKDFVSPPPTPFSLPASSLLPSPPHHATSMPDSLFSAHSPLHNSSNNAQIIQRRSFSTDSQRHLAQAASTAAAASASIKDKPCIMSGVGIVAAALPDPVLNKATPPPPPIAPRPPLIIPAAAPENQRKSRPRPPPPPPPPASSHALPQQQLPLRAAPVFVPAASTATVATLGRDMLTSKWFDD